MKVAANCNHDRSEVSCKREDLHLWRKTSPCNVLEQTAAIQKMLAEGERILWADQPDVRAMTMPSFIIYVFAVPWTLFSFGWLYFSTAGLQWLPPASGAYPAWTPRFFAATALLAFLPGVLMLTAPWWARRKAKRTIYAVTNRRVLELDVRRPEKLKSLMLAGPLIVRVKDPQEVISDMEFSLGGEGMLLRAVPRASEVMRILQEKNPGNL